MCFTRVFNCATKGKEFMEPLSSFHDYITLWCMHGNRHLPCLHNTKRKRLQLQPPPSALLRRWQEQWECEPIGPTALPFGANMGFHSLMIIVFRLRKKCPSVCHKPFQTTKKWSNIYAPPNYCVHSLKGSEIPQH